MSWKPKEERFCIDCGRKGVVERRRCSECAKEFNRQRAKDRYKKHGRYNYGIDKCAICGHQMTLWKKDQLSHASCRHKVIGDYNDVPRAKNGMTVARKLVEDLGVELTPDQTTHHLDENVYNNEPDNLIVMERADHNKLHRKLQHSRSMFLKRNDENSENCWEALRDQVTTTFLETEGVKVIKISDIVGNQQPSP